MPDIFKRRIYIFLLMLGGSLYAQQVPITAPRLIPFPQIRVGGSYLSWVPTQNLQVEGGSWSIADTLRNIGLKLDVELIRYHWGHYVLDSPRMDIHSGLVYQVATQLSAVPLPGDYPKSFILNGHPVTGFGLQTSVKDVLLDNVFTYKYSSRGSVQAALGFGLSKATIYQNADRIHLLESSTLGLKMGLGWRYILLGRPGKQIRLGVDLSYTLRTFGIEPEVESLSLPNGSAGPLTPIKEISLSTPEIALSLELGEFLFAAHTPFRDPYRLGIGNISIGYGLTSVSQGTSLQYDTTATALNIPILNRLGRNVDVQLVKYNWPFHFIKQANIDVFSGIGVRWYDSFQSTTLPAGWARNFSDGTTEYRAMKFSPHVRDIYMDHEIIYPLGPRLHAKVRGGLGFASMTLYESDALIRAIESSAMTWQLGAGFGLTMRGDGSSKVTLGASIHYYHQAFDFDPAKHGMTPLFEGELFPLTHVNLSNPSFSVDIGLIFGGNLNAAHKALLAFREKKFTRALDIQDELLDMNPEHHNKAALLIQKKDLEDSLVVYYYKDVRTILDQGRLEEALAFINRGEKPPTPAAADAVVHMREEIGTKALALAKAALDVFDYELAERSILVAVKSDPRTFSIAKVLLARSYIIRATILYQSGVYNRSLYWLKQADLMSNRYKLVTENLRKHIAEGRLDDANEGILKGDRQMTFESMRGAKALDPNLGDIVDPHLKDLQEAMKRLEEQTIAPMKRMALDNLLDDVEGLSPENFAPRIGMKSNIILRYVGDPERRFREGRYELWVYPHSPSQVVWLYMHKGVIEKIEYHPVK